ncbi:LOW QUALITY PROTEIN: hypothetical protein ACHAW5_003801 [Stephanodiscus triporus]|uniref:Uncharacterized protein n=1 Tax=Stephanodiscus triporus TaxID=2934178 RepID=A0ABD3MTT2_9STRA
MAVRQSTPRPPGPRTTDILPPRLRYHGERTCRSDHHEMHILSSPTIIEDTRYERNSLLFAEVDPRLFWPVLSNLSSTLRDMEVESEQLFQPSNAASAPVPDHAVPILLRPEWQLQMYDWDLTVSWIVPHIDGCKHVRQIAASTEVDMDMVRACLRVLRHHGALAYVDIFRYRNVYERVAPPLGERARRRVGTRFGAYRATNGSKGHSDVPSRRIAFTWAPWAHRGGATWTDGNSPEYGASNMARRLYSHMSSLHSLDLSVGNFSTARWAGRPRFTSDDSDASPRSFPSRSEIPGFIREERSNDEDDFSKGGADGDQSGNEYDEEGPWQIYSSCNRNETLGEMLLGKIGTQMNGASDSETVDAAGKDNTSIDWKLAFDYFDYRRLVTFGVVGGFLRRVHQFPLAYAIEADNDEAVTSANRRKESIATNDGDSVNHEDDSSNNSSERHFTAVAEEAAVAAKNWPWMK